MTPRVAWVVALGLGIAATGTWVVVPPARQGEPDAKPRERHQPVAVLSRPDVAIRDAGRLRARMRAERADWTLDGRTATLRGRPRITLAVETPGGRRQLHVEAHQATLDLLTQAMRLDGDLRVTGPTGVVMARTAAWDAQAQVLDLAAARADGPEVGRLRAAHIRYDVRARVVYASGHVVLAIGAWEIRTDRLRYEEETRVAYADGAVRATGGGRILTAAALRYDGRRGMVETTGGARLVQGDLVVRASILRFWVQEGVTEAAGDVEAVQGALRLGARALRHDSRTGEVTADGPVTLQRPGVRATGRRLAASLAGKHAAIVGEATLVRSGAAGAIDQETTIAARRLVIRWDVDAVEAHDGVVVRQRDRKAWADRVDYAEPRDSLVLTGRVVVEQGVAAQPAPGGLLAPGHAAGATEADGRPAPGVLPAPGVTRLYCTELVVTGRGARLDATGPVTVLQHDRRATGARATYSEPDRVLVLTGDVHVQETGGRRLRADRVVVSLADDTLEAEGDVQTEFVIRPGSAARP
jgi:lipopolysaccharide export system protein LptA